MHSMMLRLGNTGFHGLRGLVLAVMIGVAGCAAPPQQKTVLAPIAFPPPPDEARFFYERTFYSSADIVAAEPGSSFRRLVTGQDRSGGEGFAKPYAVAVRAGRIYVSDSVERFIKVLDVPSGRFYRIGDEGAGQLSKPLGLDVDSAGTVYVADATAKQVMVYGHDGRLLRKIGGEKWFDRLTSVTVDAAGTRLYVVDIGGVRSPRHQVRVFDARSGAHLFDFGTRGSGPGELNLPRDVAIGKDGRLYVVDGGNFRVSVFSPEGKYLFGWGSVGRGYGNFSRPKEIATDREGNVYVVDTGFGNIQIFDAEGVLLTFIGGRSERDGPTKYMLPSGIAVDEDGRIYMVDQWFRKVEVYRPAALKPEDGFLGHRPARKSS